MKLASAALPLLALPLVAQTQVEIDLAPGVSYSSSEPRAFSSSGLLELGGEHYFQARTGATGYELWKTDGTPAGTGMVVETKPGSGDGVEGRGVVMGGELYFRGPNASGWNEWGLWKTAGTPGSTVRIGSSPSTGAGIDPVRIVASGSRVFFTGNSENVTHPLELWVTDGSSVGTHVLMDWITDHSGWKVGLIASPTGQGVLFGGKTQGGVEPHFSDGTVAGTVQLADLDPTGSAGFEEPVAFGSSVLFLATGPAGRELHVTDGTSTGTFLLADLEPGAGSSDPWLEASVEHGGWLYFSAETAAHGRELWRTDGTATGTQLVADAVPGPGSSLALPLGTAGGQLVVRADLGQGVEPCFLQGSGLIPLADLAPGSEGSDPYHGTPIGTGLAFIASDGTERVLVVTDGTPAGTHTLTGLGTSQWVGILGEVSTGKLLLTGDLGTSGSEPLLTDGTVAGTTLLVDIDPAESHKSFNPRHLVPTGGQDLFVANLGEVAAVPSGGAATTLTSVDPFDVEGAPAQVLLAGEAMIVATARLLDGTHAVMRLHPDTGQATQLVILPGTFGIGTPRLLGANGQSLLVSAYSWAHDTELFLTDGTQAGTVLVGDLMPKHHEHEPSRAVTLDDDYLLLLPDSSQTFALWRSEFDLPTATKLLGGFTTIEPETPDPIVVGGRIYFVADDGVHGTELWTTDGTAVGTQLVIDLAPGSDHGHPTELVDFRGELHFFGATSAGGAKTLWKTDGTAAGTVALSSFALDPGGIVAANDDYLWFEHHTVWGAGQLAVWDGSVATQAGTLGYYTGDAGIVDILPMGPRAFVAAEDSSTGTELFLTDGATGTHALVADLVPGPVGSAPEHLTLCDGSLYFAATGPDGDRELWRYDLPDGHVLDLPFGGSGASLSATPPQLGSILSLTVGDAPAGSVGVLAMSAPVVYPLGLFVEPGNVLWIDPFAFTVLTASTATTFTHAQAIPNQPGLAGAQLNVQAWFLPPALLPATTSNGLRLVLGS